jgi:hypothetical protein
MNTPQTKQWVTGGWRSQQWVHGCKTLFYTVSLFALGTILVCGQPKGIQWKIRTAWIQNWCTLSRNIKIKRHKINRCKLRSGCTTRLTLSFNTEGCNRQKCQSEETKDRLPCILPYQLHGWWHLSLLHKWGIQLDSRKPELTSCIQRQKASPTLNSKCTHSIHYSCTRMCYFCEHCYKSTLCYCHFRL